MSDSNADTLKLIDYFKNNPLPNPKKTRGPGKRPALVPLSVRFDPEVVAGMKATGPGWQKRMNDIIKHWIEAERINNQSSKN